MSPPRPGLRENVDDGNLPMPTPIIPEEENMPNIVPCNERIDYKCNPDKEEKVITKKPEEYEKAYGTFCEDGGRKGIDFLSI